MKREKKWRNDAANASMEPTKRKKGKQSTIRKELMVEICILVSIPMILLGSVASFLIYRSTQATLNQTMEQLSDVAAD